MFSRRAMRVGVLTSVETRHRHFVSAIRERFQVVAVGYEQTGYSPAVVDGFDLTSAERAVVARHFEERTRQEELCFSATADFVEDSASCGVLHISPGTLNSDRTLEFLTGAGVEVVAVFGTNLIKEPLLGLFGGRLINMHLGLSPYYRGTGTNFYPLLNEEPQYVGATIQVIDRGIDSGPIIRHTRPSIVADDGPHTIGCKAIMAGIEGLIVSLEEFGEDKLRPVPQWKVPNPRLYLRQDYHPRQVVELHEKLERGLIRRYVERAAEVAGLVRLVQ